MSNRRYEALQTPVGVAGRSSEDRAGQGRTAPLGLLAGAVAVALLLAFLVALAVLGDARPRAAGSGSETGQNAEVLPQGVAPAPLLDGRGKWSGYMR